MSELSPRVIAALLGRPAPTAEQERVITAPLSPGVVVAGAGSGKTETMAARVVWLVANRHVDADEVLGLTFTRKAATELGTRVRRRLTALEATGRVEISPGEPTISTYDAFAGRIVTEHGARLGVEPGRRLLTPAGSWQRAARLVHTWDGPMDDVVLAPDTIVADVLDLHEQAAAHLADLSEVEAQTVRLVDLIERLPPSARQRKALHSRLERVYGAQRTRLRVLPLVERYRADLLRHDLADFATISADAAEITRSFPAAGRQMRAQYRLVLLDEVQDTSYAQLDLLLALFGAGHAITAVGDPFQSIYAWRGANADTLTAFVDRFAGDRDVQRHSLRTSFRNSTSVLDAANTVAEPLRREERLVDTLVPAPEASVGNVRVALHRTQHDQAAYLGDQIARRWHERSPGVDPPSIGVLVRKRDEMPLLENALRERDVPVEVVGLDGLLTVPEVSDAVALLNVCVDPARGDALIRLLTGPAVQLGPRDLAGIARWARTLAPEPAPGQPAWEAPRAGIVDCLVSPPPPGRLSAVADQRLRQVSAWVARVRARLTRPLPEVVTDAVHVLGLDVESMARARRTGGPGPGHLDRLIDEAAAFAELAPQAGVGEFLAYLDAAVQQERGLRRASEVHLGSQVQLLTVHAAKGLEWDVVAVAGLTDGGFPSRSRTGSAWLTDAGTLPYRLRGDAARLPQADTVGVTDQSELASRVEDFVAQARELDMAEERRLAYVATTRARDELLCHGYRWGAGRRPLEPSPFLLEVAARPDVAVDVWADDPGDAPGLGADTPVWPADPLGRHRPALESGAALVRAAMSDESDGTAPDIDVPVGGGRASSWGSDVDLLLAERGAERERGTRVTLPTHLSATQLVAVRRDPDEFLRRLRRPMPIRPRVETRRGTAFHAWVEQRYGNPRLLDLDELPGASDALDPPVTADLASLQKAFLASEWADRTPVEIEAPFEMVVDGVVLRGRVDAVFPDEDGLLVVDWKTGPPPTADAEVAARSAQLAAYRAAFSALHGLPLTRVRAVFHHVREGVTIEGDTTSHGLVSAMVTDVGARASR